MFRVSYGLHWIYVLLWHSGSHYFGSLHLGQFFNLISVKSSERLQKVILHVGGSLVHYVILHVLMIQCTWSKIFGWFCMVWTMVPTEVFEVSISCPHFWTPHTSKFIPKRTFESYTRPLRIMMIATNFICTEALSHKPMLWRTQKTCSGSYRVSFKRFACTQ